MRISKAIKQASKHNAELAAFRKAIAQPIKPVGSAPEVVSERPRFNQRKIGMLAAALSIAALSKQR